ncbi:MAG: aminopeptidase P family protein [Clostridiales bacterium]|nr:aminopeptidase P family protein [Clostridiales bacterium]
MNAVAKLRRKLGNTAADALLITSPQNRFYSTGFRSSAGLAFITKEKSYFSTDFRYFEDASSKIDGFELIMSTYERKYTDIINELSEKHSIKKIAFESDSVTFDEYENYRKCLSADLVSMGNLLPRLRLVKEDYEVERIKKAMAIAEGALSDLLCIIGEGMSEKEIATELEYLMMKRGAEKKSFDTIAVSGENGSHCHGVPCERKFRKGDFLTLDFGCVYEGYCSDITRTIAIGYVTDEMKNVYDTVLLAQTEALKAAKAGIVGQDLHNIAQSVIADAGYGEYFGHGLGHSLGIDVHDGVGASPSSKAVLPRGMVMSIEPGIYIPGKFGVRIEDIIRLDENGNTNLTKTPKELMII